MVRSFNAEVGQVFFKGKQPMPKQKTHKGLNKRVKVTAKGKVKRNRTGAGHLMSSKNAKRRRRVSSSTIMTSAMAKTAKVKLGE